MVIPFFFECQWQWRRYIVKKYWSCAKIWHLKKYLSVCLSVPLVSVCLCVLVITWKLIDCFALKLLYLFIYFFWFLFCFLFFWGVLRGGCLMVRKINTQIKLHITATQMQNLRTDFELEKNIYIDWKLFAFFFFFF